MGKEHKVPRTGDVSLQGPEGVRDLYTPENPMATVQKAGRSWWAQGRGPRQPSGTLRAAEDRVSVAFSVILTQPGAGGLGGWLIQGSVRTLESAQGRVHEGSAAWARWRAVSPDVGTRTARELDPCLAAASPHRANAGFTQDVLISQG